VERLVAAFGVRRLLYGSDWPVCTPLADYATVIGTARDLLGRMLASGDLDLVFGPNTVAVYAMDALLA
jgi:L-fuconolactonase